MKKKLKKKLKRTHKTPDIKLTDLLNSLRLVSAIMLTVGEDMRYFGGWGEIGDHGIDMIMAAGIVRGWADEIKKVSLK